MTLSREDILNYEEPPNQVQLPSGVIVTIKYLAYFLVLKILEAVNDEENKETVFADRVVKLLLRENDQQDLYSFSREDQVKLIEIACKEWGCKEEFDKLPSSLKAEVRFYEAVIERNNRFQHEMNERMKQFTSIVSKAVIPRLDWFDDYQKSLNAITAQFAMPLKSQLSETISKINQDTFDQFSKLSQHAVQIARIDELIKSFSTAIKIPYEESLMTSVGEALTNYRSVMDNLVSFDQFRVLPEIERYYPTIEMRNLAIAANVTLARDELVVIDEVITPESDELTGWLGDLDPAFLDMLQGAERTITSQNPDRCRHFASSHRELCTHLLHQLAPDNDVEEWTDDPNHFHEGRPTRRARLQFIGRNRNNRPFVRFFVSSFIAQMELLNADQHRRQQDYGERDLRILHEGFLATLGLLMQIFALD